MNRLICISGPDGTGKTTQVNLLINKFREKGIEYEYKWLRFHHFFSLPVLGIARLIGLSEVKELKNGDKIGYHYFYKSKIISKIYIISMYVDTLLFTLIKVHIPMKFFKSNIACDRFIYDTLIDLIISTRNNNILHSTVGKSFLRLVPNNSKFLILIADENTLKKRREDISIDKTINLKIKLYKKLANELEIPIINAGSSIENINLQILRSLNE